MVAHVDGPSSVDRDSKGVIEARRGTDAVCESQLSAACDCRDCAMQANSAESVIAKVHHDDTAIMGHGKAAGLVEKGLFGVSIPAHA